MMRDIVDRATRSSGVLAVLGGLTIFFSWMVTNTFAQKHTNLKQTIESAESDWRLYRTLYELRDATFSIASEIVQQKTGRDATEFSSGRTGDLREDQMREEFDIARLSAHQIKELYDFTQGTCSLSEAIGDTTATSTEIEHLGSQISDLQSPLSALEHRAEQVIADEHITISEAQLAVEAYVNYVRETAIPKVPTLYQAVVSASNARREEGRRELAEARYLVDISKTSSSFLYILGSCLLLGSQYLDKVRKKSPSVFRKLRRS
jgi:hypothetical protein